MFVIVLTSCDVDVILYATVGSPIIYNVITHVYNHGNRTVYLYLAYVFIMGTMTTTVHKIFIMKGAFITFHS